MITEKRTMDKLDCICERYIPMRYEKICDVPVEMCQTQAHFRQEPGREAKVKWRAVKPGARWGDNWVTAWFRGDVKLPKECQGRKVLVRAKTGGDTMLIVDGEHRGAFDRHHYEVAMTIKGVAGRKYHISLEAYAGHTFPGTQPGDRDRVTMCRNAKVFEGLELLLEREDVSGFIFDLQTIKRVADSLDENSLRRNTILGAMAKLYATIDAVPAERDESSWRPKLAEARKIMRPLLAMKNGPTAPMFGIIGHSHIDTAWLWPLAETWRKCARTFSSVLNLAEQFPEFMFVQSAPCHAEIVRKEYPGIFKRIKKMVAAGRWEPNGAMWVEPDCNLVSGESFVRQLLVGQNSTREMFGYTSDTLWLPDVFGYSAALPQILRGCDVEFFATVKISWNDTTRFPYDTFVWKGIDGSSVISHYCKTHCPPDPTNLVAAWKWIQHKDVQDRRLFAFGDGDGGGGPTNEEIELARRTSDLEGCPRTQWTTVSDFMKGVRDELTELPEWSGELYLELHRGTLTSIAKIKRGNRKTENAMRQAEFLATLACLNGAKRKYPASELLELWKTLLTLQFHDILPGSSIARVNDEAIEEFDRILGRANAIVDASAEALAGSPGKDKSKLLVFNSLSWNRTGEIVLSGVPSGMRPADPNVKAQWIENIDGDRALAIDGIALPGLGAELIELAKGKPDGETPFKIGKNTVETPFAKIRFDKIGRIVSLVDKASGRQVVKSGGALNSLLIGEDIPREWDNWDIDGDQHMKIGIEDRLVKREVVADGPLQLRIRSEYQLGARSKLVQDMVFHSSTARIDFETVVDWSEKHQLLKAGFEFDILADTARHEIQYGHVARPTHQNRPADRAMFEVCAHKWTDISDNGFGVAVLNDCKYGLGVRGSEVRLSLLKSGRRPDPRGDEGRHYFTYSMLPHDCAFSVEAVVRPAYELNIPVTVVQAGEKANRFDGLVSIDAPNVIVESIKWAEQGKGFVIRLYDAGKIGRTVKVTFNNVNVPVKSVDETNMLEEKPTKLALKNDSVSFFLRAFEIKTLYCAV